MKTILDYLFCTGIIFLCAKAAQVKTSSALLIASLWPLTLGVWLWDMVVDLWNGDVE